MSPRLGFSTFARIARQALVVATVFFAAACAQSSGPNDTPPGDDGPDASPDDPDPEFIYPDPDWTVGAPGDHGLDAASLELASDAAERLDSNCLLVIRNGVLVMERYYDGADATTRSKSWSIAKTYSGTLVGIALERGEISSLDDSVADYVSEWRGTPNEAITVRDIVSMTSGLDWSAFKDYGQMTMLSSDHTAFALDLSLEETPGSTWTYHNGGVQILEPLLRGATGMSVEDYAAAHLWSKIGMSAEWGRDRAGNPTTYANVLSPCRDHARFGYLLLREGKWRGGAEVIPSDWLQAALSPSQELNRAYGRLIWLNGYEPALSAMNEAKDGVLAPFAPSDMFAARGFGNQFIDVIPSLDLVVVRLGKDPMSSFDLGALINDARFDIHAEILQPILDAVR